MFRLTPQAQELKKSHPTPSMGELVKQASDQLEAFNRQQPGQIRPA